MAIGVFDFWKFLITVPLLLSKLLKSTHDPQNKFENLAKISEKIEKFCINFQNNSKIGRKVRNPVRNSLLCTIHKKNFKILLKNFEFNLSPIIYTWPYQRHDRKHSYSTADSHCRHCIPYSSEPFWVLQNPDKIKEQSLFLFK